MAESIQAFGNRVNAHLDAIGTSVDGIVADVTALKALIEKLQNNPDVVTPADQDTINAIEARIGSLATKVKELDDATAPAENPTPS